MNAKHLLGLVSGSLILTSVLFLAHHGEAQPSTPAEAAHLKFATRQLRLQGKTVVVELADTDERRTQGLMFREKLPDGHGMLFIFDSEQPLGFWMKNTLIPLSIGYFDHDRKLLRVFEMTPAIAGEASPRTYRSVLPAKYALEMPQGWFTQNKVEDGAHFEFSDERNLPQH